MRFNGSVADFVLQRVHKSTLPVKNIFDSENWLHEPGSIIDETAWELVVAGKKMQHSFRSTDCTTSSKASEDFYAIRNRLHRMIDNPEETETLDWMED